MAEFTSAQTINNEYSDIEVTDVMTGGMDQRMYLYYQLISSLKKADRVDIVVSFLMESGVKMLLSELEGALNRGAKIRILTVKYISVHRIYQEVH